MNKVATTYWGNTPAISIPVNNGTKTVARAESATPQWFVFIVIASITFMLCMAINLRAYSEMSAEAKQNERLSIELENLANENLAIQEEVHNLKVDSRAIEHETRKIRMNRPNEKIIVPVN